MRRISANVSALIDACVGRFFESESGGGERIDFFSNFFRTQLACGFVFFLVR